MTKRRHFSEYRPLGVGFNVIVGDDDGNRAQAVFDFDDGWMDVTDPANPTELKFKPTWFETIPARE